MKKLPFLVVLVLLVIVLMAGSALAQMPSNVQTRTDKWEISLQTRYTNAKDFTYDNGSGLSVEDDLGWGFEWGYNFSEKFHLGMLFTWRSMGYQATAISQDDPGETLDYSGVMDTSTIGLTGRWTPMEGKIKPYVNGGIGWMAIDSNIYAGSEGVCWWDPFWMQYICGVYNTTYGTDAATYDLGVGVDFTLTRSLFIRVGYEHAWVDLNSYDSADMFRVDFGGVF